MKTRTLLLLLAGMLVFAGGQGAWWALVGDRPVLAELAGVPPPIEKPAHPHRTAPRMGATVPAPKPPAFASDWIVYNSTDPATGTKIMHARLVALAAPDALAPIVMEVRQDGSPHLFIIFTIPGAAGACVPASSLTLRFDGAAPRSYQASASPIDADCVLSFDAGNDFMALILSASTMVLSAPRYPGATIVSFNVKGLTLPQD